MAKHREAFREEIYAKQYRSVIIGRMLKSATSIEQENGEFVFYWWD